MRIAASWFWLACLGWITAANAADAPGFDTRPEQAVIARLLPQQARQFELAALPANDGSERFRISRANQHDHSLLRRFDHLRQCPLARRIALLPR